MTFSDAAIEELKLRNPCDQVAGRWVKLRRAGAKWMGPCPICSADPQKRDSTRFECTADGWVCAVCPDGGDVIKLVQRVNRLGFQEACAWLGGVRELDAQEAARLEAERAARAARAETDALAFRERERRTAFEIWLRGRDAAGSDAERYLALRGVPAPAGMRLRVIDDMPYYDSGAKDAGVIHRGPAMLAPILRNDRHFAGVHVTYLDLSSPKGKLRLEADGAALPAKKVRGSKKGGHIEVLGPTAPKRLVIGEGIEKVLAVWRALASVNEPAWAESAFWTSVDLGNLGGKHAGTVAHPTLKTAAGRAQRVPGPEPDRAAPAIEIPASVAEVVVLGDSTSDRFGTWCTIQRAAARWARPGLALRVAWSPDGADFDDLFVRDGAAAASAAIAAIVADAPEISPAAAPAAASDQTGGRREPAAPSSSPPDNVVALRPSHGAADPPAPAGASDPPGAVVASAQPRSSQTGGRSKANPRRGKGGEDTAALDMRLAFYPQTDLGNAERFVERHRGRLLWCPALGWLWWDGRRWCREGADERVKIAEHETVRAIQDEADAVAGTDRDRIVSTKYKGKKDEEPVHLSDTLRGWGRASEAANRLSPIAKRAAPYLHVAPGDLDADPFAINVRNGTLVVRKAEGGDSIALKPHDPADLITKLCPVDYDPQATCPAYDDFLAYVQPAAETRRFLHQWQGLSLTGDVSEQKLAVFWGKGKNGKSTFVDACAFVGGDYSETVPIETFLVEGRGRNAGQATPDLAILPSVRHLRTSEPDKGAKLAEALIKLATGGEPIQARHLNRDYFKFYPAFKLTISGNYRPSIAGADEGIWRRVILVPWSVIVPEEKRDKQLGIKLRAEASGILNRLLDGLRDWLEHGLVTPEEVRAATADYRRDSDPLGRWIEACVAQDPGGRVQSSEAHALFNAWAKANSAAEWTPKGFSLAMKERGFVSKHSNVMWWLDIKLTKVVDDFVDHEGKPRSESRAVKGERRDDDLAF